MGNIVGQVRVAREGFPPKAILVNLQTRGATINSVYTDNQGAFGFYSLPSGLYHIVIHDSDYELVDERVVVDTSVSQDSYVQIILTPSSDEPRTQGAGQPGSNPNVVSLSQYTKRFPKKVVKEYRKGVDAEKSGNSKSAVQHLEKAIEMAPDFYPAHNELGLIYLGQTNFTGAEQQFGQVIKLDPTDPEAYLNLGNVYLLIHHYDEALKSIQAGLQRNPQSALGKFLLGSVYGRLGKLPDASQALHEALQLDPRMAKAHLELVNIYLAENNQPQAIAQLREFLKAAPNDPLAPKVKQVLKRLQHAQTASRR